MRRLEFGMAALALMAALAVPLVAAADGPRTSHELRGPYLGQKPPGASHELDAPFFSADGGRLFFLDMPPDANGMSGAATVS